MRLGMKVLNWRVPKLVEGENSILRLPELIQSLLLKRVLIVTDVGIKKTKLMEP